MHLRIDGDQGDVLEASVTEFMPLSYTDLVKIPIQKNKPHSFRITAKSDKHTFNKQDNEENADLSFNGNKGDASLFSQPYK